MSPRIQTNEKTQTTDKSTVVEKESTVDASAHAPEGTESTEATETTAPTQTRTLAKGDPALQLHEELEVKAFGELLDEYSKRYNYRDAQKDVDEAAHRKLHAAVHMLLRLEGQALKQAFSLMVNRFSQENKHGAFVMPNLVRHLNTNNLIQNSGERVFIGEFLSLVSKFARLPVDQKQNISKRANVSKVMESLSDQPTRDRIRSLFPE